MKRVVIIDDGVNIHGPLSQFIKGKGMDITHVTKDQLWIDALKERPDILLVDISTYGQSGFGIIRYVQVYFKGVRIYAFGNHDDIPKNLDVQTQGWFKKIDEPAAIAKTITEGE